jgi:uncharacterized membrane protein YfcA
MPGPWSLFSIGMFVGYVSGLFGKGGSAIATPLLQLSGAPAFIAVASPLPATVPGALVATVTYLRQGFYDKKTILWSITAGFPATILGAWSSKFTSGTSLLLLSNLILIGLGTAFFFPVRHSEDNPPTEGAPTDAMQRVRRGVWLNFAIAAVVGFVSGLLANAGGFLLAPLYVKLLRLPIKTAFACSMLVSVVLAVPGTVVHMDLGHIDWKVVLYLALGSIPLAYLGAKSAIRMHVRLLTPFFGLVNVVIGVLGAADSMGWHLLHL